MPLAGSKLYLGSTLVGGSGADQAPSKPLTHDVDAATSVRTAVTATASGTPHAAGSWVEVASSLPADSSLLSIMTTAPINASGTNSSTLLEIGTGGSGSEAVWATIGVGYTPGLQVFTVPGRIASGTRVAVRARSAVASQAVSAVCTFHAAKATVLAAPTTYQADTATSRGLTITAPGSLNTKGAWTQITASTGARLSVLAITPQAAGSTSMSSTGVLIDIGTGGSGSETVIIPDLYLAGNSLERYTANMPLTYGVDIPAGTRIAARYARANAGNAVDLIVIGA